MSNFRSKYWKLGVRPLCVMFAVVLLATYASTYANPPYVASQLTPDHAFTHDIEGPATDASGFIYAVNFAKDGTIGKVTPDGRGEIFVELPAGSTGNGIRFASDGSMRVADYTGHSVLKVDIRTKKVTVLAHEPRMHQPNDIAITRHDTLFASDPDWKNNTGQLWKISNKGKVTLLEQNMGTTNGIEVSPDAKRLYVNESVQRKIWVYDLDRRLRPRNKRLLIEFPDFGLDGMRCDPRGDLYVARYGKGTVLELSPQGKVLHEVQLKGKNPTNVTFSPDYKTLYVTVQDTGALETFGVE